ncbi:MAG TPA: Mur ligase family protein [Patescibacteria group bacterium]|nr:Mur ligase family protein [Patescibacteria group bacterium]
MRKFIVGIVLFYFKFFAKIALLIHKPITIGIAGSVGKSSTRNALEAILKDYKKTKIVRGNSETGVPLGILEIEMESYKLPQWLKAIALSPFKIMATKKYVYMIVEMGIDDPFPPKNMEYLLSIIKPDISISLNISATHTLQFSKLLNRKPKDKEDYEFLLEKIAEEDTKIISKSGCKLGIYDKDNKYLDNELKNFKGTELLTFGKSTSNNIYFDEYMVDTDGTEFTFVLDGQKIDIKLKHLVLPEAYREVLAPAILTAYKLGIDTKTITENLENNYSLPKGRASVFKGIKGTIIIDSSYNSSKLAVITFLKLAKNLAEKKKTEVAFLMGDMRELGDLAEKEHKEIAKLINECVDYLYCVGPLTHEFVIPNVSKNIKKSIWFENSNEAGKFLAEHLPKGVILLVKGSQNNIFLEEAIKPLLLNKEDEKKLPRQEKYWKKS